MLMPVFSPSACVHAVAGVLLGRPKDVRRFNRLINITRVFGFAYAHMLAGIRAAHGLATVCFFCTTNFAYLCVPLSTWIFPLPISRAVATVLGIW